MVEASRLEPCGDTEKVEPLLVIVRRVRLSLHRMRSRANDMCKPESAEDGSACSDLRWQNLVSDVSRDVSLCRAVISTCVIQPSGLHMCLFHVECIWNQ